jgi:starvation-inducible DNA-binding protein
MNELQAALKIALANTFLMYFQAHSYHWNVEGMNFPQLHSFFGDLYEDLFGAVDPMAEELRALDQYAPSSLSEIYQYRSTATEPGRPSSDVEMIRKLMASNDQVVAALQKVFDLASDNNKQGLADFVASRLDIHSKHRWMLKALIS